MLRDAQYMNNLEVYTMTEIVRLQTNLGDIDIALNEEKLKKPVIILKLMSNQVSMTARFFIVLLKTA